MRIILYIILLSWCATSPMVSQEKSRDLAFQNENRKPDIYFIMDSIRQQAEKEGRKNKQAERWFSFWKPRLAPHGTFDVMPDNLGFIYSDYMNQLPASKGFARASHTGDWEYIGGDTYSVDVVAPNAEGGSGGAGRLNCLAVDPVDGNILYVGAAVGGLWKTTDGGVSWTCLTDGMSNIGVSSIVVDPFDSDRILIASGDSDSGDANYRDMGILMTEDGGVSWFQVHDVDGRIYKIMAHPSQQNTFYVCSMDGFYQTTNSFATLDTLYVSPGNGRNWHVWDAEFKPENPDSIYFSTGRTIRCFNDATDQVTSLVTFLPGMGGGTNRIEIETTPLNPEMIVGFYARSGDAVQNGFIHHPVSIDGGVTWQQNADTLNIMGRDTLGNDNISQAWYDMCFVLGADDPAKIMTGGLQIWTSSDTGNTHVCKTYGRRITNLSYVHVDHHDMLNRNDTIYVVNDGGLYRTTNFGDSWVELSDGIGIHQVYDMHSWAGHPDSIMGGLQDNGFYRYHSGQHCTQRHGGDGMAIFQHPENVGTQIAMHTYGRVRKTEDDWSTVTTLISTSSSNAQFHAALYIDETQPDTIYLAQNENIVRTYTCDTNWTNVFSNVPGYYSALLQNEQNRNRFYAGFWNTTSNKSFLNYCANIHSASPVFTVIGAAELPDTIVISDIECQPGDANKVFVSYSGFADSAKVYYRPDPMTPFTNISAGLPNVPINDLEFEVGSVQNGLYAATDIGVFYRNDTLGEWIYFSNGMPNVVVSEVEYIESRDVIRAATYGRGIWESDVYASCPASILLTMANDPSNENYTGVQRYQSQNTISSARHVVGGRGTDVRYRAGNYVELTDGFEAHHHSLLQVENGPCSTSGVQFFKMRKPSGMMLRQRPLAVKK